MPDLVTLEGIEEAAQKIKGVAVRTPLVPFPFTEPPLLIKPESLQPVGAFKLRGAYAAIAALPEEQRVRGVVTHSSGNHAQAVAYAARTLGVPAVLVMPRTAPRVKADACRRLGAQVVFVEPTGAARAGAVERLVSQHRYAFVPPYDHPQVIAGQGTIGVEIVADAPDVEVVLVPVSGGGLIAGVATAVKALRPRAKVIGVEPELAAHARDSLRVGTPVAWDPAETGRTIADALRVECVGDLPFAHIRAYVDDIVTVSDDELREAMRRLCRAARLVAEPGGAAATAACLFHRAELPAAGSYVAVLSGGNVSPRMFADVVGRDEPFAGTG